MNVQSISLPNPTCDECGRTAIKIMRVYKSHRYCGTCYARVFKRLLCPSCKNFARLPRNISGAICRKCDTKKPCVRCGATEYRIGKITAYGPACASCSPYFLPPMPCEKCGSSSTQLTTVARLGDDLKLCGKCARSDFKTCSGCRRYRLCTADHDGRLICNVCRDIGNINCGSCGGDMPAGRGQQCEQCYWKSVAQKRAKTNSEILSKGSMRQSFLVFISWLIDEVGPQKAAQNQTQYISFFQEVEQRWGEFPAYELLLKHFSAEGLRRIRLVTRWLSASGLIEINVTLKEADSNSRTIGRLLNTFDPESAPGHLLASYHQALLQKHAAGQITLKSICLSLRPAARLLECATAMKAMLPSQIALSRYLKGSPGQRAALSGFIAHINRHHQLALKLPAPSSQTPAQRRKKAEQKILEILQNPQDESFEKRWITLGLTYFHGLPTRIGLRIKASDVTSEDNGSMTIVWEGNSYYLPSPHSTIMP